MSDQPGFISADQFHPDPHTQSRTAERTLNAAIVHADISRSYEEYLEIFDAFYDDDIEGSSETTEEPIHRKAGVRAHLAWIRRPHDWRRFDLVAVGSCGIPPFEIGIDGSVRSRYQRPAWFAFSTQPW